MQDMTTKVFRIDENTETLVPAVGVNPVYFPGGHETHVNFDSADDADYSGRKYAIRLYDGRFQSVGDALVIADALWRRGADEVHLLAPYLPSARQDRGAPFSAKVYADAINLGEFTTVVVVDAHSDVMPAYVNNIAFLYAADVFPYTLIQDMNDTTVIAPDKGAHTRASEVAMRYGLPLVTAEKKRVDGRVTEYHCPKPETKYAVVIDDICDGGATFNFLAQAIDMPRENLTLWNTHGIYSSPRGLDELRENYGTIATTNSFASFHTADVVMDIDEMMVARALEIKSLMDRVAASKDAEPVDFEEFSARVLGEEN